jgi:hypothetical protein
VLEQKGEQVSSSCERRRAWFGGGGGPPISVATAVDSEDQLASSIFFSFHTQNSPFQPFYTLLIIILVPPFQVFFFCNKKRLRSFEAVCIL